MRIPISEKRLKNNSRKMDALNRRLTEIAKKLNRLKPTKENEAILNKLMEEAKSNRIRHEALQEEINLLVRLDHALVA